MHRKKLWVLICTASVSRYLLYLTGTALSLVKLSLQDLPERCGNAGVNFSPTQLLILLTKDIPLEHNPINKAAHIIKHASHVTAFTGAGISVESGIPPFRGKGGLWNTYNPVFIDIDYFKANPLASWKLIKEVFYDFFGNAQPNAAHAGLAKLEQHNYIKAIITQNIDSLHYLAGSSEVYEFHGNSRELVCVKCLQKCLASDVNLDDLPPECKVCGGFLKPDFVFFGEPIPEKVQEKSFMQTQIADVFLLIGTSGEVMPACEIPYLAKSKGALVIEINTGPSKFTNKVTDVFLEGKAGEMVDALVGKIISDG
jgi:NAD-dependent deacetylase